MYYVCVYEWSCKEVNCPGQQLCGCGSHSVLRTYVLMYVQVCIRIKSVHISVVVAVVAIVGSRAA